MGSELESILNSWTMLERSGESAVLATVVKTQGSTYRRPGARLLLRQDGSRIGSISGGCLESDLTRKAHWYTRAGRVVVKRYDTTALAGEIAEFGLGCNGVVDVLLEPIPHLGSTRYRELLCSCIQSRMQATVATVIASNSCTEPMIGDRAWCATGVKHDCLFSSEALSASVERDLQSVGKHGVSCIKCYEHSGTRVDIFYEVIRPSPHLFIFGVGLDVDPVIKLAKCLGWKVTLIDTGASFLRGSAATLADQALRFRNADIPQDVVFEADALVLLMTHNYVHDQRILKSLLPLRLRYLGVLGPKERSAKMLAELSIPSRRTLHAPTGLDIGADSPSEIALSIIAEMQAVLGHRSGGYLRDREGPIHDRKQDVEH